MGGEQRRKKQRSKEEEEKRRVDGGGQQQQQASWAEGLCLAAPCVPFSFPPWKGKKEIEGGKEENLFLLLLLLR